MGITDEVMRHYGIPIPSDDGLVSPEGHARGPVGEATEEIVVDRNGNKSITVSELPRGTACCSRVVDPLWPEGGTQTHCPHVIHGELPRGQPAELRSPPTHVWCGVQQSMQKSI